MLCILLQRCTQECVISAINSLTAKISLHTFKKSFKVILTDNGSEFKDPWSIEKTPDGKFRTYVFYCDPYESNHKGKLEKNHEFIRYIIPKGKSMANYTQADFSLMASHINSVARDGLNGRSPYDLAELLLDTKIPASLGMHKVSPRLRHTETGTLEKIKVNCKTNFQFAKITKTGSYLAKIDFIGVG